MRWFFIFWAMLLAPLCADSQTWVWTTETVDTAGVGMSLAVDDDGNVHISYSAGALKYAFRPMEESLWFKMPLSYGAEFTTIRLDRKGNPQICAAYPFRDLRYAHFDGKKWAVDEIIPNGPGLQASCALAVGNDGTVHIAWYRYGSGNHIHYAVLKDGVWTTRTLDWDEQTGKFNSMVLDSQGNPYISYDAYVKGLLKCAQWDGKSWKMQVVDSRGPTQYNVGMGNSLVLDPQGNIQISYYTEHALQYARQKNSTWKIETVENVDTAWGRSDREHRSSLALDKNGFPHISFEDLGALKHAYWNGKRWYTQLIAPNGPVPYRYSSMAIDKRQDILYVSYQDSLDGSLKVAVGREVSAAQHAEFKTKTQEKE